ncbi:MAG: NmrA family NAD(P)-binding protein [Gammaproteobacteria bacterium]
MILLTGITGNNGGATATALLEKGAKIRALVRDLDKASAWADKGVELFQGDLSDAASIKAALEGVESAVLVLNNSKEQESLELNFIAAAKDAGLPWIIKVSSPEAVRGTTSPLPLAHIAAEDAIMESGMNWTFVRPSFFMQNFRGSIPKAKETGVLAMPMGDSGTAALTDCADAGAFIAHILTDGNKEQHYGQVYDITGPDPVMTFAEIAQQVGEALGTEVKYVAADPQKFQEIMRPFVSSDWHSDAVAHLFAEIADGTTPGIKTDTFEKIMGHPGRSFKEFVKECA